MSHNPSFPPGNRTSEDVLNEEMQNLKNNFDMFFLIVNGLFVFLLQAATAFYESSCVRAKNITSVLFRNYFDACISTLAFVCTGYAFAFGAGNGFCGTEYFGLIGLPDDKLAHFFFQFTFAATGTTIVKGTIHERCTMTAYLCYSVFISAYVYPVATHWAAAKNGWLMQLGFEDYAGSGVVHSLGGTASLVATYIAGPRLRRFDERGAENKIPSHSAAQAGFASFVYLFAMIAFNGGSQGSISRPEDGNAIGKVILNSVVCVGASTVTALLFHRFAIERTKEGWDFDNGLNGSFVGMVVVCAGCDRYPSWGAVVVGSLSYFAYILGRKLLQLFKIDDPVGSLGVQIFGGYFGLLGVSIFKEGGLVLAPSKATAYALLINAMGGIAIMAWSAANMFLLYLILCRLKLHRVHRSSEKIGLDASVHKQLAYVYDDWAHKKALIENNSTVSTASTVSTILPRPISESRSTSLHSVPTAGRREDRQITLSHRIRPSSVDLPLPGTVC